MKITLHDSGPCEKCGAFDSCCETSARRKLHWSQAMDLVDELKERIQIREALIRDMAEEIRCLKESAAISR